MQRIVGTRWGASPTVMLLLVRQVLIPKLFFGVECWATVVRSDRFLCSLDLVLGQSARLSLGLDRFCLTETALTVANLMPARLQVLQFLCKYMIRNCIEDLIIPGRQVVPKTFLLPREIAQAWFWRSVQAKGLIPCPPPASRRVLLPAIRKGLLTEWATSGVQLRKWLRLKMHFLLWARLIFYRNRGIGFNFLHFCVFD